MVPKELVGELVAVTGSRVASQRDGLGLSRDRCSSQP